MLSAGMLGTSSEINAPRVTTAPANATAGRAASATLSRPSSTRAGPTGVSDAPAGAPPPMPSPTPLTISARDLGRDVARRRQIVAYETRRLRHEDRADERDAERGADLAHHAGRAARRTRLLMRDVAQHHVGELARRETDADAVQHERGEQRPEGRRRRERRDVQPDAERLHREPDRDHVFRSEAPAQLAADAAADERHDPRGQQPGSALDRGEVQAGLQEDRQHEERAELAHREHGGVDQPVPESAMDEIGEVEHHGLPAGPVASRGARTNASTTTAINNETERSRPCAPAIPNRRSTDHRSVSTIRSAPPR